MDDHKEEIFAQLTYFFKCNYFYRYEDVCIIFEDKNMPCYTPPNKVYISMSWDSEDYARFAFMLAHQLVFVYMTNSFIRNRFNWIEELLASNFCFYALDYLNDVNKSHGADYFKSYKESRLKEMRMSNLVLAKKLVADNISRFESAPELVYLGDLQHQRRYLGSYDEVNCARTDPFSFDQYDGRLRRYLYDLKLDIFKLMKVFREVKYGLKITQNEQFYQKMLEISNNSKEVTSLLALL